MYPGNSNNGNPLIYTFEDENGVKHQAVPVNHEHSINEILGLNSILSNLQTALANAITWKTVATDLHIGNGGANAYDQHALYNFSDMDTLFDYQQIRLRQTGVSQNPIVIYGAITEMGLTQGPPRIYVTMDLYDGRVNPGYSFSIEVLQ